MNGAEFIQAHLTAEYQWKACDTLLRKTQVELGKANSYIEELEDLLKAKEQIIANYEHKCDNLKKQLKNIRAQYLNDREELDKSIREKELFKSIRADRDKWRTLCENALAARDSAISQLVKLNYGRDIQKMD